MNRFNHLSKTEFLRSIDYTQGKSPIIDELVRRLESAVVERAELEEQIPSYRPLETCSVCEAKLNVNI